MEIISHRGIWKTKEEQNSTESLLCSLRLGYSVEFDVRDYKSELVISHDIPDNKSQKLEVFFNKIQNKKNYLLINIKSDGLQSKLNHLLKKYKIKNYFVFDMSIPDTIIYIKFKIKFLIRLSEYETNLALLNKSSGLWIDHFHKKIIDEKKIISYLKLNKKIFFVSPELHRKHHIENWKMLKKIKYKFPLSKMFLCTDFPVKAERFFND